MGHIPSNILFAWYIPDIDSPRQMTYTSVIHMSRLRQLCNKQI